MIINGESLEQLKLMEENSIDHIITDPPYLIDFMGKKWDSADNIAGSVDFWKEALRVCKDGSYALVFGHSRTHHRVMAAIEDAGWEIRDCLMWLQGQGFPKSHELGAKIDKAKGLIGHRGKRVKHQHGHEHLDKPEAIKKHEPISAEAKEWSGWGENLKPAYEPIIMARKPFKGSLTNNVLINKTGALNIDACRVGTEVMPARETKTETTGIGWEKHGYTSPQTTGRHPSNVILSHSEGCRKIGETTETIIGGNKGSSGFVNGYESGDFTKIESPVELYYCEEGCPVKLIDQQAPKTGNAFTATRKKKTSGGSGNSWTNNGKEEGQTNGVYDGLGGASRFFYVAKVSSKERNFGCEELPQRQTIGGGGTETDIAGAYGSVKSKSGNHHPTLKPIELMKYLVKLVSREGQTILDPFTGSGSTGIAAELLDRNFIGIEMDADYCEIAEKRISAWKEKENKTIDEETET